MRFFVASALALGLGCVPGPASSTPATPAFPTAPDSIVEASDHSVSAASTWSPDRRSTVTLVTGDVVTLLPGAHGTEATVRVHPRRGSDGLPIGYAIRRHEGHLSVVPSDVTRLVGTVLDPALFDVTSLVQMGYDDRRTDQLPLIVARAPGVHTLAGADPALRPSHLLSSIHATAVTVDKDDATSFGYELSTAASATPRKAVSALGGIRHVWLDGKVRASELDGYLQQIHAQEAFDTGLTGSGVTVAVLDTGVDPGHPTLSGTIEQQANFTDTSSPDDANGHGTHVTSLIAGNGAFSGGARQGVSPGVDVLAGKVLGDDAIGQDSWVIEGMEWAVAQHADIVNMSLGGPASETDDPVAQALDGLAADSGALFVVAAGNSGGFGPSPFTIESPGLAASALTVGAATSTDGQAGFSSEGPTSGSYRLKPDLLAPGVDILGAKAGARDGDVYTSYSGTSQATPQVAGAAALLMEEHPSWTWERVKAQLVGSTDQTPYWSPYANGSGRLDLARALGPISADLANVDFGYLRHPDNSVQTKTLTLSNSGGSPVQVSLADHERAYGLGDQPEAPADAVTATPAALTIPAGGQASTVITLDPRQLEDTIWQGQLTASAGGDTLVNLAVGAYDEPEKYNVHVHVIDRNGDPYAGGWARLKNAVGQDFDQVALDQNGNGVARVSPGFYSAFSEVTTPAGVEPRDTVTVAGDSEFPVRHDTSVTIDARQGKLLRAPTVAGVPTHVVMGWLSYMRHSDSNGAGGELVLTPQDVELRRIYATPTQRVKHGRFEYATRWRLEPNHQAKKHRPDLYELLSTKDRFTNPLSPKLTSADVRRMARMDDTIGGVTEPGGTDSGLAWETDECACSLISWRPISVPRHEAVVLSAAPDAMWERCVSIPTVGVTDSCDRGYHSYAPRARRTVRWAAGLHPDVHQAYHCASTLYVSTGLSDGEHSGFFQGRSVESSQLTLTPEGGESTTANDTFGYFSAPPENTRHTLHQSLTLNANDIPVSTSSDTTWHFWSAAPDDPTVVGATTPRLLTLDYGPDVDDLGMTGVDAPLHLALTVGHLPSDRPGGPAPAITDAALSYSVDGGSTWTPMRLRRVGRGQYTTVVPKRGLRSAVSVSLRASAQDAGGGSVNQTVIGMVPVR